MIIAKSARDVKEYERCALISLLASTFVHDPIVSYWLCPQEPRVERLRSWFNREWYEFCRQGSVIFFSDTLDAVAITFPSQDAGCLFCSLLKTLPQDIRAAGLRNWLRILRLRLTSRHSAASLGLLNIEFFAVREDRRGKGLGGDLMRMIERFAAVNAYDCVLETANLSSRSFFEHHGWKVVTIIPGRRGAPDFWRMRFSARPEV